MVESCLADDIANIRDIFALRNAYIHNAETNHISEDDVDKLEKIVYGLILQLTRKSKEYKSIKEIFEAIDKGLFVPQVRRQKFPREGTKISS